MVGIHGLTVKVSNISERTTPEDLVTFFSYCGSIDDITMEKDGEQARSAMVTFVQPYAYQTALLLNGAVLVDRRVSILPMGNAANSHQARSSKSDERNREAQNGGGGFGPTQRPSLQAPTAGGHKMLNRAKELDEKCRISQTGRAATEKSTAAIATAEQATGRLGSTILSRSCFSKGVLWLSEVLNKVSKRAAELGNYRYGDKNTGKKK